MSVTAKLMEIQIKLKAPKNLYNKFGEYPFRNAEGILEAVKPFLAMTNTCVTLSDEIVAVGDRIYVKATAELVDTESGDIVMTTAFAREPDDKKGMDGSQITGTASSYARKYALNGLFALDDTKDADTDEYHKQTEEKPKPEPQVPDNLQEIHVKAIEAIAEKKNVPIEAILKRYNVERLAQLTNKQYANLMASLEKSSGGAA